jgi:hypothetical protein
MYETVQKYSGRVYVLDTNLLWCGDQPKANQVGCV